MKYLIFSTSHLMLYTIWLLYKLPKKFNHYILFQPSQEILNKIMHIIVYRFSHSFPIFICLQHKSSWNIKDIPSLHLIYALGKSCRDLGCVILTLRGKAVWVWRFVGYGGLCCMAFRGLRWLAFFYTFYRVSCTGGREILHPTFYYSHEI